MVVLTVPTVVADGVWLLLEKLMVGGVPEEGETLAVKLTAELNPFSAVVDRLMLPLCPATMLGMGLGAQFKLKSVTFSVALSVLVTPLSVKDAVMVAVAALLPVAVRPDMVAMPVLEEL